MKNPSCYIHDSRTTPGFARADQYISVCHKTFARVSTLALARSAPEVVLVKAIVASPSQEQLRLRWTRRLHATNGKAILPLLFSLHSSADASHIEQIVSRDSSTLLSSCFWPWTGRRAFSEGKMRSSGGFLRNARQASLRKRPARVPEPSNLRPCELGNVLRAGLTNRRNG